MHELSIVQSIVDIAEEQVRKAGAVTVDSIELEIGTLAGVEWDALDFAWQAAVPRTVLANAERIVQRVPARARCSNCQAEFELPEWFAPCPDCGETLSNLLQGRELRVKSLVVS
ncbi:MAG: hydrogenase maturation nickel metallochaperone HypA [Saprospirales bacterium]|nr:hydrogenase maturation nickel metallochaperone HypA [Saprospirales bacterium]MBK8491437.1 hydrogenase maturation nickel metallochaperone HypA [Saprospirales bacterium]